MIARPTLLDAETGTLCCDWIVLAAMILGTSASVLALWDDDVPLTRAGLSPAACAAAPAMPCPVR